MRRSSSSSARSGTSARTASARSWVSSPSGATAAHFVRRGRLVAAEEFDPAVHQKATGGRFWDSKDYCNNFVLRKGPG